MACVIDRRRALAALGCGALIAACPLSIEPPQLRTRRAEFTGVDGDDLQFRVELDAYNPNGFELAVRRLDARLVLDGHDAGSSVTSLSVSLPPMRWVPFTANVTVPRHGAPSYLLLPEWSPVVAYALEGRVTAEHQIAVRATFVHHDVLPREVFLRSASSTVNNMASSVLPGFGGVQMQEGSSSASSETGAPARASATVRSFAPDSGPPFSDAGSSALVRGRR